MRYLPSLVVFLVLCGAWVFADRAQLQALETEKRDSASRILRNIQTQMDKYISRTLRASRGLVAHIDPSFNIEQQSFKPG